MPRKSYRWFTTGERDRLKLWRACGLSIPQCAAKLNRTADSVRGFCERNGIRDPDHNDPEVRRILREAHALGYSDRRIARVLRLPYSTVYSIRTTLGLKANGKRGRQEELPEPPDLCLCRHCHRNKAVGHRRGLCRRCSNDLEIRGSYPTRATGRGVRKPSEPYREPTAEELDELIAEQRRHLPAWWGEANREDR